MKICIRILWFLFILCGCVAIFPKTIDYAAFMEGLAYFSVIGYAWLVILGFVLIGIGYAKLFNELVIKKIKR